jgi:hypothetical protein
MKREPWIWAGICLLLALIVGVVLAGYFGPGPFSGPAAREGAGTGAEHSSPRRLF